VKGSNDIQILPDVSRLQKRARTRVKTLASILNTKPLGGLERSRLERDGDMARILDLNLEIARFARPFVHGPVWRLGRVHFGLY
jgi:hypothetical protein